MHVVRMSSAPGSHSGSAQTSTQAPSDSHFDLERAPSVGSSSRSLPRETPRQFGSLAAALLRCESGETVPRLRAGDSVDMEGFLRGGVGSASSAGGASTMRSTASSRSHSLPTGGGDGTASSAGAHVPQSCFSRSSMSSSMASSVSGLSNPRGSGASFNFAGISTPLTSTHFQDPVGVVREHVQRLCADMENGGKAVNSAAAVADQCVSQECREEERASFASFSSMDQSYGGGALTSRKLSPGEPGRLARDSLGPAEAIGSAAAARTSRSSGKAALHVGVEHGLEDGGVACDGPNPFSSLGALTDICNGGASSGIFANLANLSGILPVAGVEPAEPDAQSELVHSKAAELAAILAEISSLSRAQKESEVAVLAERRRLSEEQSVMRAEYEQAEHRAYQLQAEESAAAEGFQRRVDRERRRRKDQREALEQTGLLCEQLEQQLEEKGRALRSAEEREEHQESQICALTEQVRLLEVQAEEKPATARRRLFASPANEDSGLPVSEENSLRSARSAGSGWIPLEALGQGSAEREAELQRALEQLERERHIARQREQAVLAEARGQWEQELALRDSELREKDAALRSALDDVQRQGQSCARYEQQAQESAAALETLGAELSAAQDQRFSFSDAACLEALSSELSCAREQRESDAAVLQSLGAELQISRDLRVSDAEALEGLMAELQAAREAQAQSADAEALEGLMAEQLARASDWSEEQRTEIERLAAQVTALQAREDRLAREAADEKHAMTWRHGGTSQAEMSTPQAAAADAGDASAASPRSRSGSSLPRTLRHPPGQGTTTPPAPHAPQALCRGAQSTPRRQRSASGESLVPGEEAPRRGCVLEKVIAFEQRCQSQGCTPRAPSVTSLRECFEPLTEASRRGMVTPPVPTPLRTGRGWRD